MDWKKLWTDITTYFTDNVWNIVGFIAALVLGFILIKILLNIIRRILKKTKMENITQNFLFAFIKLALYLIFVLILLSILGVQITGIITALSAMILAVGMALQNNIANLANGIVIVSNHMFKKGDYILVDGKEGSITNINFLFTTIMTTDNKKVTIPNSTIVNSSVVNAGANNTRRLDFTFSVAYETDVETVKKLVLDVMHSDGRVYLDPAPFCRLKTLGASSIDFFANCWCDTPDYWDCYYYIIENVYNEFKRNGISIPYNQLEVRSRTEIVEMPYNDKKLPKRVEKDRPVSKTHLDLETANLSDFIKIKKKDKKSAKKKTATDVETPLPKDPESLDLTMTTEPENDAEKLELEKPQN